MFYSYTKEILDEFNNTFSLKKDFADCYDIENGVFNAKEGCLSLTEYHETLNGLCMELD